MQILHRRQHTTIIDHIYDIYEPVRLALLTHVTLKADTEIIPIVISRTGTFHVKALAEIAQLVSFTEEPPNELAFKQLSTIVKKNCNDTLCTYKRMAILNI